MTFILHIMRDLSFYIYTKKKRAVILRKKEKETNNIHELCDYFYRHFNSHLDFYAMTET